MHKCISPCYSGTVNDLVHYYFNEQHKTEKPITLTLRMESLFAGATRNSVVSCPELVWRVTNKYLQGDIFASIFSTDGFHHMLKGQLLYC